MNIRDRVEFSCLPSCGLLRRSAFLLCTCRYLRLDTFVLRSPITSMAPNSNMVSLNAKDGSVRWNIAVADARQGYWTTMAPLVVGNHVIVGVGGDLDNIPMFLQAFDPETGKLQWKWDVDPQAGA